MYLKNTKVNKNKPKHIEKLKYYSIENFDL